MTDGDRTGHGPGAPGPIPGSTGYFREGPLGSHAAPRTFGQHFKELAAPIRAYYLFIGVMLVIFSVSAFVDSRDSSNDFYIVLGFWISTLMGVVVGQVLAVARIRSWVVALLTGIWWAVSVAVVASQVLSADESMIWLGIFMFTFPFFLWGGLFSLRVKRAFPASWVPLMYGVVSVIIVTERRGRDAAWYAGQKWAIWDTATLLILGVTICLLVLYLVVREKHRLARWQRAPGALLQGSLKEMGHARPRLTVGGWVLLVVSALVLTVGTAVAAPYLWRTGPRQGRADDDHGDPQPDPGRPQDPQSGGEPRDDSSGDTWEQVRQALQEAAEAMAETARTYWPLVVLILLLVLAVLAAWRPAARVVVLRYLRSPPWPLPATRRIENAWRIVEVALGDLGFHRAPRETAMALCHRTLAELPDLDPAVRARLVQAASTRDRVLFSLGVGPRDEQDSLDDATWLYPRLRSSLEARMRVKSLYRKI